MPKAIPLSKSLMLSAASSSNNWSEFYSNLGFEGRPGGSTQHRIRNLVKEHKVDVSHFHVQRGPLIRWTDEDLSVAVASSKSWREVSDKLNSSHNTIKKKAFNLGLDVSHFSDSSKSYSPLPKVDHGTVDRTRLRYASEHMAIAWYTLRGYDVLIPAIPCPVDFVAIRDGKSIKVQVKSTSSTTFSLIRHVETSKYTSTIKYTKEDIDEFFLVDGNYKMYRIPLSMVDGRCTVAVSRCRHNEVKFSV